MRTLVIGRGLLGGAVVRRSAGTAESADHVPWSTPDAAVEHLRDTVRAHTTQPGWRIAWCAGSGTVGSHQAALDTETSFLEAVLDAVTPGSGDGSKFVLVSSAGGIHAAGTPEWIDEAAPPAPRSPYGFNKLRQEDLTRDWAARVGADLLIARPSNLFGPGQRLGKPQGLVSQVLYRTLRRQPITISVAEETQRDYVYVDDAAGWILRWITQPPHGRVDTKIVCAGRSVTIAHLLRVVRAATGVEPRIVRRATAASTLQPRHLRYRSTVHRELDAPVRTLEAGIALTWADLLARFAAGELAAHDRPTGPRGTLSA